MIDMWNSADPFAVLALAIAVDAAIGDAAGLFRRLPHPVVAIGHAIAALDRALNDPALSPRRRRDRGVLTLAIVVTGAGLAAWALGWLLQLLPFAWIWQAGAVAVLLAQRSLYDHVAAVAQALQQHGLTSGRAAVGHIVGRDPETLNEAGVARAAIESAAENFSDGVIAPAFWYLVAGLPGLFAYKAVNTLDSMIGHRSEQYRDFGRAAARLDDLANLLPARLAGCLLAAAGLFAAHADARRAFATMRRDAPRHPSPNAGWQEAAVAGALGLALNGPRRYGGTLHDDPWMGDGRTDAGAADIRAALRLYCWAGLLFWGATTAIAVI